MGVIVKLIPLSQQHGSITLSMRRPLRRCVVFSERGLYEGERGYESTRIRG